MNKKILIICITTLTVIMLTAPIIGTANAVPHENRKKTVVPYENSISLGVVPETSVDNWVKDGYILIRKGTQREGPYDGPLGVGMMYSESIISKTTFSDPPGGITPGASGIGGAVYKEIYVIESGPFGAGTLEGICIMEWESNTAQEPRYYNYVGYSIFNHGTGGLKGIKLEYTTTGSALPQGPGLPPPPGIQQGIMSIP